MKLTDLISFLELKFYNLSIASMNSLLDDPAYLALIFVS